MGTATGNTIRVQREDGGWTELECSISGQNGSPELTVPGWGVWSISEAAMIGNIGGNDWRIYTLHPDDCARLVEQYRKEGGK